MCESIPDSWKGWISCQAVSLEGQKRTRELARRLWNERVVDITHSQRVLPIIQDEAARDLYDIRVIWYGQGSWITGDCPGERRWS